MRPALTETPWKKPSRVVQGWGAVQNQITWGSPHRWMKDGAQVTKPRIFRWIVQLQHWSEDHVIASSKPPIWANGCQSTPRSSTILMNGVVYSLGRIISRPALAHNHMRFRNTPDLLREAVDREVGDAIVNDNDEEFHAGLSILNHRAKTMSNQRRCSLGQNAPLANSWSAIMSRTGAKTSDLRRRPPMTRNQAIGETRFIGWKCVDGKCRVRSILGT